MLDMCVKNAVQPELYTGYVETESMGARIRRLRLKAGMTQQQLADALGITKSAISQWELDQSENIKLPTFMRLCYILRQEPHYVIFGAGRGTDSLSRKNG